MNWPNPAIHLASPGLRPRLVYARDDSSGSDERPSAPVRLLIVEDDYLVATQMEETLTDAGFEVTAVVASAEDAITTVRAEPVTLAIMDVRLAGKRDGIEAALELFSKHGIRCIFATAHSDPEIRARAEPAMPLAWLQKPYSMASLVALVRRAVKPTGKR